MQTGKEIKKKTGLKREETDWNWEILHKSIYAYLHKRKLLSPRAKVLFFFVFFFAGTSLFSYILFFFDIETKLKQWISQNTEEKLLYCTHCHTNVWSHLISLFYYSQLRFDFILQSFLTSRRKIVKSRICKSSFRLGLRRWRYLRTMKKFFWCF